MDLAAAGAAAAQISAAQRTQQISISALRSNQLQAQSLASMLSGSTASSASAAPVAPAASGGNGGDTGGGSSNSSNAAAARGSLLNILV